MKKLYRAIIYVENIESLHKGCCKLFENRNYQAVIDFLKLYDDGEYGILDFDEDEECYLATDDTDEKYTYNGYTLIYNPTLGGVFLLYREANQQERDWWFQKTRK